MIEESTPSKSTVVEIEQAHDSGAESTSTPGSPEYDAIRDILEISQSEPVSLGWRTWLVVFISAFLAIFAQIYTTVAAPSTIAFIIQDLGDPQLAVWVIQAPLLMQAVLNPLLGRLSDVIDRKLLITVPAVLAVAGSVLSAKANDMYMLIGGGILYGVSLATIGIAQTIPAEILPRKYRTLSNGISFVGGSVGGTLGGFLAGVFCQTPGGWRNMFWMQTGVNALFAVCIFAFYWPAKNLRIRNKSLRQIIWDCDPIGAVLFVAGSTATLMALNWASGLYSWSNPHVYATLVVGLILLISFGLYEWKAREDGLVSHIFFKSGFNFPLATFAFMVEGWMFYSAVNTVTTQMHLYLGWAGNSLQISIRQLPFSLAAMFVSIPIIWYSTRYKEVKWPLVMGFSFFLIASSAYAGVQTSWNHAQLGISVIAGIGQAAPLTLLISVVQFTAPHKFLSTATGLAFALRAVGGAFGSAILYTIINGKLKSDYTPKVAAAAIAAGLPEEQLPVLLQVMAGGNGPPTEAGLIAVVSQIIPGVKEAAIIAARNAGHDVYAHAYRLAWASIVPFCFLALVCVCCLRSVKVFMTETVEAPLEKEHHNAQEDTEKRGAQ